MAKEALLRAMKVFAPEERSPHHRVILESTHALLRASLDLCSIGGREMRGVTWACYIIENAPMVSPPRLAPPNVSATSYKSQKGISQYLRSRQNLQHALGIIWILLRRSSDCSLWGHTSPDDMGDICVLSGRSNWQDCLFHARSA